MLTRPITPMALSVFRSFFGVSDAYIPWIAGYPYINVAILAQKKFIRKRLFFVLSHVLDKEFFTVCG